MSQVPAPDEATPHDPAHEPAHDPAQATRSACPSCGATLAAGAKFCEACGASVADVSAAAEAGPESPIDDLSPISTPTFRNTSASASPTVAGPRACASCGSPVGDDGYCTVCGSKAASERDHFEETPAPWVAGVCDRGIKHHRNEDAMALYAEAAQGGRAVLVVCDGVSNSDDSDVASLAAARAALEVLRPPLPKGIGGAASADAAATRVFTSAAAAAQTAVIAHTEPSSPRPASCTFVVGLLDGPTLRCAVIGDSRAYLLPDEGGGTQLLTDDSMAQMLIDAGHPRAEAEASPQAHAITKWLGSDSPDFVPRVVTVTVDEPGWLLVCSDGLWNYASEPAALRAQIDAAGTTEPLALASALVAFANAQGGQDNITVTLARVGPVPVVENVPNDERQIHG
ncbi:protein phosphatase 2C domain-containing protein [Knoellia sp. S7-12]|uniref:protein phosphatase 2C domain-containing protein n=1 Tax=Knoellia sp. S7-12 TaxID=3126698 RepID=UPI00336714D5